MKRILKALIYSLVLAAGCLIAVSALWERPFLLTIIIVGIGIGFLSITRKIEDIILYLVVSISGAVAEIIAIYFGAWTYTSANVAGIPFWLAPLWGAAAVYVKRMSEEINEFVKEKIKIKTPKKKSSKSKNKKNKK